MAIDDVEGIERLDTIKDRPLDAVAIGVLQFNRVPDAVHEGVVPGLLTRTQSERLCLERKGTIRHRISGGNSRKDETRVLCIRLLTC